MTRYVVKLTDDLANVAAHEPWPPGVAGTPWGAILNSVTGAVLEDPPKPPKPAEPTEFGAMVKDRDGVAWVRTVPAPIAVTFPWAPSNDDGFRDYADIDAVDVLR